MARSNDSFRASVLVVDDEAAIRDSLHMILEYEGYRVEEASSGSQALAKVADRAPDAVILDIKMPEMDGLDVLKAFRERGYDMPVLMISGHADVQTAVEATRRGAYDFFEKPLQRERILVSLRNAVESHRLHTENSVLRQEPDQLIGNAPAMRRLRETIEKAAPTPATVLITGESGTGKELVARDIHRLSPRRDRALVQVNCAAIPEELIESELFGHRKGAFTGAIDDRKGKFELADGGTLFLDEVGDMSLKTQAKVLRVLQEQTFQRVGGQQTIKVDVRVIAATNKDLEAEIAAGSFRSDLYYRLNVIPIEVPPLRARGNDVVLLAEHFLRRFAAETGQAKKKLSPGAAAKLKAYHWPGNVRELRNVAERLAILLPGEIIEAEDVHLGPPRAEPPPEIAANLPLKEAREQFEKQYILDRLREYAGNVSRTAESLGVERSNLYRKMDAYGIRSSPKAPSEVEGPT
jgi:two-component system nitrogen regulation response regulator NtrX